MKNYVATVSSNLPYPVTREYRIEATGISTVAQRAVKLFRKDKPRKKIDEVTIKIKYLGKPYDIHTKMD